MLDLENPSFVARDNDSDVDDSGQNKSIENTYRDESIDLEIISPSALKNDIQTNNIDLAQLENDIFNQYILDSGPTQQDNTDISNFDITTHSPNNSNGDDDDEDMLSSFIKTEQTPRTNNNNNNSATNSISNYNNNTTTVNKANYTTTFKQNIPTQFINMTQNSPIPDRAASVPIIKTNNHINSHINNNININVNNNNSRIIPSLMETKFKSLIEETLTFGRTKEITSNPIDPINYIHIDENTLPCKLILDGLPQVTRVENQLKLSLIMSPPIENKYLVYLPIDSITRERFYLSNDIITYPKNLQEQLLYLDAFILDNITNKNIEVCNKCVNREQRRASRRKSKISDNLLWCNNPNRRAIIFNNKQISLIEQIDSGSKKIELTTRIVCYCRHHKSDEGFKLLFVLKDFMGNVIAKTVSNPIVITDRKQQIIDVNNNVVSHYQQQKQRPSTSIDIPTLSTYPSTTTNAINPSSTTNENSTSNSTTPGQYFDSVDHTFQITNQSQQTTSTTPQHLFNQLNSSQQQFSYSHPSQPQQKEHNVFDHTGRKIIPSPTSMSEDGSESIPTELLYNKNNQQSQVNNNNRKRSRVSMPNIVTKNNLLKQYSSSASNTIQPMTDFSYQQQQLQQQQLQLQNQQIYIPSPEQPAIERVIPSRGPINGGIEVTLLGSRFKQGLVVKFGDNMALSTQCWSESTILTYLPPAMAAGQVVVTVTDPNNPDLNPITNTHPSQKAIFTYVDETDRQLIELALQIVGLKMNGKLEDAKNIAKRIVDDDDKSPSSSSQHQAASNNTSNQSNNALNDSVLMDNDEQLIIKVIQSLNKTTSNLSMCDDQGRTLLHLACLKGYTKLVATLVKSGVFVDSRDKFDFTPLHFAAVGGNYKIIRLLLACHSDSLALTDNGITVKKLYEDNHITDSDYDDVIDLFDHYMASNLPGINRQLSQTSCGSSVFENDSMLSLNEQDYNPRDESNFTSTLYIESSEGSNYGDTGYDEYEEEFGLSDDIEDSNSVASVDDNDANNGKIADSAIAHSVSDADVNEKARDQTLIQAGSATVSTNNTTTSEEPSAWNRLLSRINEDLPKYDDLYPRNWTQSKKKELTVSGTKQEEECTSTRRRNSGVLSMDSHTSSEDEEDAIQKRFNQFFQNNTLAMHKDKMLLFFWLPVGILLLTWVLWLQFSNDSNDFINKINGWVQHYVAMGLAKIVLGNQRMKTVFRDGINNLQTSGILNDLIVS